MNFTDVKIRVRKNDGKMKALVSVTIDGLFAIHDMKIIEREDGSRFIAMPSRKMPDGTFLDIVHPIDSDTRKLLESVVLSAYDQESKED
jgi:stage V sporulation protein G